MTINDWLTATTNKFTSAGIESARLDALLLLENALGTSRETLLARPDYELSKENIADLAVNVERRLKFEPIAYIVGHKEFYGLDFLVNKSVLVPRPETEKAVEYILRNAANKTRILDMGTGSGAIAIALKKNRFDLEVSASEISRSALNIARINAANNNTFIGFMESDLFSKIRAQNQFGCIVANLPYLKLDSMTSDPEIMHEPTIALFADESDGLSQYRRFFRRVDQYLTPEGFVISEHDPSQLEEMKKLARQSDLATESISPFISRFYPPEPRNIDIK